jgi:hypothetical protein
VNDEKTVLPHRVFPKTAAHLLLGFIVLLDLSWCAAGSNLCLAHTYRIRPWLRALDHAGFVVGVEDARARRRWIFYIPRTQFIDYVKFRLNPDSLIAYAERQSHGNLASRPAQGEPPSGTTKASEGGDVGPMLLGSTHAFAYPEQDGMDGSRSVYTDAGQ